MTFEEVSKRVKLPVEIDKKYSDDQLKLGEWIQRDLEKSRTLRIVDYINKTRQRFFNSLILGIYKGSPSWQEIQVSQRSTTQVQQIGEETEIYLSNSVGILSLNGDENIFAIDGQHRAIGIREAVKLNKEILNDEVPVIFVAHKASFDGNVRTRRLFSTLNRYAKPVGKSDIIALSEDDNCAIITRELIDHFELFKNRIIVNKSPSINPENSVDFTNIRTLYEIVERIITNKKVYAFNVQGEDHYSFTNTRVEDDTLEKHITRIKRYLTSTLTILPAFQKYNSTGTLERSVKGSLIFRPIGQFIYFDVLKVAEANNKLHAAKTFFASHDFSLKNKVWKTIFWDEESNNIKTDKPRVKYATMLIIEHIGISFKKTKKERELFESFNLTLG
ncbi:hypothetical protein GCM10028786_24420 [Flaviaesturariibacter terrae]